MSSHKFHLGETVFNVIKEQSFFGDIRVLFSVPHSTYFRARRKNILLVLTIEILAKILESYPNIARNIAQISKERYTVHIKHE